jgi:hypothetical protein
MRLCGIQQIKQAPPKYRLSGRPNTWILSTAMKAKAKKVRKRNDEMARIQRENVASRKRVMRARALGQESKEFCLAHYMRDATLDFSRVEAKDIED